MRARQQGLAAALALCLAALAAAPWSARAELGLEGTWHVLIHYTDDLAADPEQLRWDDRVWVFQREGSRLRWTEYPIVVFGDRTGRFEPGRSGMRRVVGAWEPTPTQVAQIRDGLAINTRGSKSKTLRGSDAEGWSSTRRRGGASAMTVTYEELWAIERKSGLPVFSRSDTLMGGAAESFEGRTEYAALEIAPDGSSIRGRFERDGTRHGTFRMTRAGAVSPVQGSGKTQGERTAALFRDLAAAILDGDEEAFAAAELARLRESGEEIPEALRREIRTRIRAALEAALEARGVSPREAGPQIQSLTRSIERALVDEGRPEAEIAEMLRDGRLGP